MKKCILGCVVAVSLSIISMLAVQADYTEYSDYFEE